MAENISTQLVFHTNNLVNVVGHIDDQYYPGEVCYTFKPRIGRRLGKIDEVIDVIYEPGNTYHDQQVEYVGSPYTWPILKYAREEHYPTQCTVDLTWNFESPDDTDTFLVSYYPFNITQTEYAYTAVGARNTKRLYFLPKPCDKQMLYALGRFDDGSIQLLFRGTGIEDQPWEDIPGDTYCKRHDYYSVSVAGKKLVKMVAFYEEPNWTFLPMFDPKNGMLLRNSSIFEPGLIRHGDPIVI